MTKRETNLLLTGFTIFFFSGFLLANSILLCASFIPLFIYLIGLFVSPLEVHTEKIGLPRSAKLGEIIEIKISGKVSGGPGTVIICDLIPEPFQLVEGSNYKVVSKELKMREHEEKPFSFSYKMRCTKCGNYRIWLGLEKRHILGLIQTHISVEETGQLSVFPVSPGIRKIKLPVSTTKKTYANQNITKIGPFSTDFREIRNYFPGDSFKTINWKASAKAAGRGKLYPLVNEYEREGKRAMWLFLDANPDLRIGTSLENTLEYGIRTACTISYYFLSKGYSLGMYIYNHRRKIFHLDTGKKQFVKFADALLNLNTPKAGLQVFCNEGFSEAIEQTWKYLLAYSPGIVVITHVTQNNWAELLSGLRKTLLYKRRKRQPNVFVINILPYSIIPKAHPWEISAARILDVASRSFSNRLRNWGVTVFDWDPKGENIELLLLNTLQIR